MEYKTERSIFLKSAAIHDDWNEFIDDETYKQLIEIERLIGIDLNNDYNLLSPSINQVLRFMEFPANEIKIVILGQDPYPQKGIATGRAFEVNGLKSWSQSFRNPSLQNIIRSAYYAHSGNLIKFNDIRKLLITRFEIFSPQNIFNKWEKQGVLLLNKSLTCKLNTPGSHTEIWDKFTEKLIRFLNHNSSDIYWLIWGKHALEAISHIKPKNMIFSYHPSRCQNRENDFLYGETNCFKETSHLINWLGYKEKPTLF